MVATLVGGHVCSPLFLVGTPTTPAFLRAEPMGSYGAVPPLTMTVMACTHSVLEKTVSTFQSLCLHVPCRVDHLKPAEMSILVHTWLGPPYPHCMVFLVVLFD